MMNCPKCGRFMAYSGTFVQGVFYCPVCHHSVFASIGLSSNTTALSFGAGLSNTTIGYGEVTRNWEDPPARAPVPQAFHKAFEDVEVLEP